MKEGSWWEGRGGGGRGGEGEGGGGWEGREGRRVGGLVGWEGKGRKEESVAAHYSLGSSVGPHGNLACGLSVFVCVDFLM